MSEYVYRLQTCINIINIPIVALQLANLADLETIIFNETDFIFKITMFELLTFKY